MGFGRFVKISWTNGNGRIGPLFVISSMIGFCVGVNMFFHKYQMGLLDW
jgi:hypothetical protein